MLATDFFHVDCAVTLQLWAITLFGSAASFVIR
jgi:hypothetical protein